MLILNSDKDVQQVSGGGAGTLLSEIILQVYYFLTILRCLWLRDSDPRQWEGVTRLVSNLEHRRGTK